MWRSAPSNSTSTATLFSAWVAASPPIPTPTASGTSACTRPHRSSGVAPAPADEYLCQPFRLTDHHVVTGDHRDHRAGHGRDAPALLPSRQRTIPAGEYPRPWHVGKLPAVDLLGHEVN